MHVIFKYSLIEEAKNIFEIVAHYNEYKDLRSVVLPSIKDVIDAMFNQDKSIKEFSDIWGKIEAEFNKAVVATELTPLNTDIICFTHKFGCEGWFNADKNQIHVRTTESSKRNTLDSIMHEVLHLITYKPDMSYADREDIVGKHIGLLPYQQILAKL